MDAQLNNKLDRLLQLMEPPKPNEKRTFEQNVEAYRIKRKLKFKYK